MVLLNASHEQRQEQRRRAVVVTFPGLDWIEEMERTKRGQEKRQQEKQARHAAKQYFKNKRIQVRNAARVAAITTVAAPSLETMLGFKNFLDFLSSSPCNDTTATNTNDNNRQAILDLPLCSATLSTFASHSNITSGAATILTEASTQQDKIKLIGKLKSKMMDKTAPLDIVVYYSGLVWMTQAKSKGLYDFNIGKPSILQGNHSDSNDNDDKAIHPHDQYEDGGGAVGKQQNDENSVKGDTFIETTKNEEKKGISKQAQPLLFTDNEDHEDNGGTVVPNVDVKKNTHQSSHHERDNWLQLACMLCAKLLETR